MNKLDLDRIMAQEPSLNIGGFGLSNLKKYSSDEHQAELQKRREELVRALNICTKVATWLKANVTSRTTINRSLTSYSWKHIVETEIGEYVPNGAFIAAAIYCGFKHKPSSPHSPNVHLNIANYRAVKQYSLA